MRYWLLKSEPDVYGLERLQQDRYSLWDGVRNYQARNFLKQMSVGDLCFFYHSSTAEPGIVGLCQVSQTQVVDPSQFDPQSPYHDPQSPPHNPRWWTVQVEFVRAFNELLPLPLLRQHFSPDELWTLRRGNRLSVMPVPENVAQRLLQMAASSNP